MSTMFTATASVKSGSATDHPIHCAQISFPFCFEPRDDTHSEPAEQAKAICRAWGWTEIMSLDLVEGGTFPIKHGEEFVPDQFPWGSPSVNIGEWTLTRQDAIAFIERFGLDHKLEDWPDEHLKEWIVEWMSHDFKEAECFDDADEYPASFYLGD